MFLLNKNQQGNPTPDSFNLAAERASMSVFMKRYGNPQEYQPGRPVPRIAYQATQKISDDLRPFIKETAITVDSRGRGPIPDDYVHLSSLKYRYYENPDTCTTTDPTIVPNDRKIVVLPDDKLSDRLTSSLLPVNKMYPICTIRDTYYQFYPTNIGRVIMVYLRIPAVPKWGYSTTSGEPTYDAATSTDLEWPDEMMNELTVAALAFMGVYLREADVFQAADKFMKEGV